MAHKHESREQAYEKYQKFPIDLINRRLYLHAFDKVTKMIERCWKKILTAGLSIVYRSLSSRTILAICNYH